MTPAADHPVCSLDDPRVAALLERLHRAARQPLGTARHVAALLGDRLRRRQPTVPEEVARLKDLYAPVTRKQGRLLYLLARSLRAERVVEFGTAFGISTTYLAAAMRDNGGGVVIGSELDPGKIAAARRNLAEAGLDAQVEIRQGDARETLAEPGGPIDLLVLDAYLPLYLPLLQRLTPHLRHGAGVAAVNVTTFRRALAPYRAWVNDPANGFCSVTLLIGDGIEYAVRL